MRSELLIASYSHARDEPVGGRLHFHRCHFDIKLIELRRESVVSLLADPIDGFASLLVQRFAGLGRNARFDLRLCPTLAGMVFADCPVASIASEKGHPIVVCCHSDQPAAALGIDIALLKVNALVVYHNGFSSGK